jgi:hypothetical protein
MRRLLLLAKKLESLPRGRFNYDVWVGGDWGGKKDLSCGTVACALGWATTLPSLRKAGLRMCNEGDYGYVGLVGGSCPEFADPSIYAATVVFALTVDEARHLFIPDAEVGINATAKRVAKKIRYFVTTEQMNGQRVTMQYPF